MLNETGTKSHEREEKEEVPGPEEEKMPKAQNVVLLCASVALMLIAAWTAADVVAAALAGL